MLGMQLRLTSLTSYRLFVLSVLLVFAGTVWLWLLPIAGLNRFIRDAYFDEDALMPFSYSPLFDQQELSYAQSVWSRLEQLYAKNDEEGVQRLLLESMRQSDMQAHTQKFRARTSIRFDLSKRPHPPFNSNASEADLRDSRVHTNVYGTLYNADNNEAMVVEVKYGRSRMAVVSLAIAMIHSLKDVRWQSKNLILLFTPDSLYFGEGLGAWLDAYHKDGKHNLVTEAEGVVQAGTIRAALNLDCLDSSDWSQTTVLAGGVNGHLANLDYYFVAAMNLLYRARRVSVAPGAPHKSSFPPGSWYYDSFVPFVKSMAAGLPSGNQHFFLRHNINAISITTPEPGPIGDTKSFFKTVEMIVHAVSNLEERLHASTCFYILLAATKYQPFNCFIPFALLLVAGVLKAVSIFYRSSAAEENEERNQALRRQQHAAHVASGTNSDATVLADLSPTDATTTRSAESAVHRIEYTRADLTGLVLVCLVLSLCVCLLLLPAWLQTAAGDRSIDLDLMSGVLLVAVFVVWVVSQFVVLPWVRRMRLELRFDSVHFDCKLTKAKSQNAAQSADIDGDATAAASEESALMLQCYGLLYHVGAVAVFGMLNFSLALLTAPVTMFGLIVAHPVRCSRRASLVRVLGLCLLCVALSPFCVYAASVWLMQGGITYPASVLLHAFFADGNALLLWVGLVYLPWWIWIANIVAWAPMPLHASSSHGHAD
eukprot:gnl/Hemi2/3131_TR1110_c0_g1_i1.p1 gnl/Hemi2/3131_TR1110_c0_g1~~gnl/Hemi2/3131_TR1110_c0_g1_i1.p1  ORF type:complete len:710 (+),score=231.81 gnl/Hemi2/3131_TR1110_c0_g1_i1:83-2212(+)